ncbi:MAG: hypothetical protein ACT4NL_04380 [Pseudomarimonas sp.]
MSRPLSTKKPSLPRPLRLSLWLLLLAYLAYVVIANLLLNLPSADAMLNRSPERFKVTWSRAITPWPGRVWAEGVVVTGHTRNTRWMANASSVRARIALLPLAARVLQFPEIEAQELRFEADRVDEFMPPRERSPMAWTVDLPRIHSAGVRALRWNDLRLDGLGEVAFAMRKQLRGGPLEILPSTLAMHASQFTRDGTVLFKAAKLQLGLAMDEHLASEHPGRAKLALMRIALNIEAVTDALDLTLGKNNKLAIAPRPAASADDAGSVSIALVLDHGELVSGGRMSMVMPLSFAIADGRRDNNQLRVQIDVAQAITLSARLPQQPDGFAHLDAELRIAQRRLPLDGWAPLLANTSGRVSTRWRFESLRWLSELLVQKPWLDFDGAGELDADLQIAAGHLAPGSRFVLPHMQLVADVLNDRISGHGHATGRLDASADGSSRTQVKVQLDQFRIAPQADPSLAYVEGKALTIDLAAAGDLAKIKDSMRARVRLSDAQVADLTHYNSYLPKRDISFVSGRGAFSGDLSLDAQGQVSRGRLGVRATDARMRIAKLDLAGDVLIDMRLAESNLKERTFNLDGSRIDLSRVSFRDGTGVEQRDWWTRIRLGRAHALWGRPMEIDADTAISMKNVGFLLTLFSQKKPFPRWVARLVDDGEAEVSTQLQLRGKSLVLDHLLAQNQRFGVRSRLHLAEGQAQGDLLLRWGVLSLGVELADTERDYRLIGAKKWFEDRPDLLQPLPVR